MKIVFLDAATLGDTPLCSIEAFGELVCYPTSTPEQALERVKDADILIINKIKVTSEMMDAAPGLKLICEAATGINNIDVDAASRRGIPVRNVAGYSTPSVAQLTWSHILALTGRTRRFDSRVKNGTYSASGLFTDVSENWNELAGKTLGVIGMGQIGSRVAAVGEAFGMKVAYFSTSGTSHCTQYPSLPLPELLAVSDVVTVHAPLNSRTAGLIGERELAMMKSSAVLVNSGRGGIVDETALARALDAGVIAGAALDVFVTEPLPADSPLLHLAHPERVQFTPHCAWASVEARARLVEGIAKNIEDFIKS